MTIAVWLRVGSGVFGIRRMPTREVATDFADLTLSLMAEPNPELQGFLPQRPGRSLHKLGDLRYRSPCLRMLLQQLNVSGSVWLTCCFLFRFGQFDLLEFTARLISTRSLVIK